MPRKDRENRKNDPLDVTTHTERTRRDGTKDRYSNHLHLPADRSKGIICGRDVIDTSSRENQLLLFRLDASMQREAYRQRPINAVPKPEPRARRAKEPHVWDEAMMLCPKCGGEYPDCVWCNGDRVVTVKQAREMGFAG